MNEVLRSAIRKYSLIRVSMKKSTLAACVKFQRFVVGLCWRFVDTPFAQERDS